MSTELRRIIKIVSVLIAQYSLLSLSAQAAATDVYISQTGGGNGSSCSSPQSVGFFNNSSNWGTGVGQIGPGTTVHLCGTISSNLTFQGGGNSTSNVTLDGTGATMNAYIDVGTSYWTIQNLTWNTSYATNNSGQAAIQLLGGWSNGIIQNNHIDIQNSAQVIFAFFGSNLLVQNNYLRVSSPSGDNFDTDVFDWPGVTNVTLQGNYMELHINEPDACGQASGGCHDDIIQTWAYNGYTPTNATIRYNYFANTSPAATGPANLSHCMIEGTAGTWLIYGNVFYSTGAGTGDANGCGMGPGTFYVYNNTFVNQNGGLATQLGGGGTVTVENNLFYRDTSGNSPGAMLRQNMSSLTFDHNFFYSPSSGDWPNGCTSQSGDLCTTNSSTAAALFTNVSADNFGLGNNSAAIGAGINLGASYNQAIMPGATWPNPPLGTRPASGAWDIGAYQFGSAPPPACLNACDINCDGADNVGDVQMEINMALQKATCTNFSGACNVTSVQKVINAALGGTCVAP